MLRALPIRLSPPSPSVCTCSQPPLRTCPPRSLRCLAGGLPPASSPQLMPFAAAPWLRTHGCSLTAPPLRVLTPWQCPAVGGHAFCCTRALMDAAPPSPPFLSLMLAAVHRCARALMHCCHPSCSPARRRVLDSPSAHVHALLLLLEPVSAMLSSLGWAHAHGGRRARCGAYAYLLWTSPSV